MRAIDHRIVILKAIYSHAIKDVNNWRSTSLLDFVGIFNILFEVRLNHNMFIICAHLWMKLCVAEIVINKMGFFVILGGF